MKRAFDFVVALGLVSVLSPVLALTALAVAAGSGFPVLFRQVRVGRNFRLFRICKFRTMRPEGERKGRKITVRGDGRVTGVGRFLRRYKLDELPQLFNVLAGDMSIVGPRPEVPEYVERYRDEYRELLTVRPGITDRTSVKYRSEEELLGTRSNPEEYYLQVLLPEKIRMSLEYVRSRTFWTDMKILVETARAVFSP